MPNKMKPVDYIRSSRRILASRAADLEVKRIGVLGTYTVDFLLPYLVVIGADKGFLLDLDAGPFNQIELQLMDPNSVFVQPDVDLIVIAARFEDLLPDFRTRTRSASKLELKDLVEEVVARIVNGVKVARTRTNAVFVILNFAPRKSVV